MIPSYSSIYGLGHKALRDLNVFSHRLSVTEKLDGSQFSWMKDSNGEVHFRSKGAVIHIGNEPPMFSQGVQAILGLRDFLTPNYIYRGEYFQKPKHNSLAYSRIPKHHVILFDIQDGPESYLSYEDMKAEADRIGFEVVPLLYQGFVTDADQVKSFLTQESVLGGVTPEGVVFKAYGVYGPDKKTLMGKYVTEAFKEVHRTEWKNTNPTPTDVVQNLITELKTDARWEKAIQHLRERGELTETPKDIGALMKEVAADIKKEEIDYIKDKLFAHAWQRISRGVVAGFPQWYKDRLMQEGFEALDNTPNSD